MKKENFPPLQLVFAKHDRVSWFKVTKIFSAKIFSIYFHPLNIFIMFHITLHMKAGHSAIISRISL